MDSSLGQVGLMLPRLPHNREKPGMASAPTTSWAGQSYPLKVALMSWDLGSWSTWTLASSSRVGTAGGGPGTCASGWAQSEGPMLAVSRLA